MNVWGKNERSWRKARKRGVSPIIATILLVAITVVLAAVLYVLISGLTKGPGGTTLGSAFAMAESTTNGLVVGAAGATYAGSGCAATHYCYVLTIESASPGLTPNAMDMVVKLSSGATYNIGTATSGITIYNTVTATVVTQCTAIAAGGALSVSTWSVGTPTTQLSSTMEIIVDMGVTVSPAGSNLVISALGVGSYSGTVSASLA